MRIARFVRIPFMGRLDRDQSPDIPNSAGFETTRWSVVLAAANGVTSESRDALAALCAGYWYPVYGFIRQRIHDPDRAADLTQGFFTRLLEKADLRSVDPAKGQFRAFLLAACKHFLSNEHDRETAQKRGGGRCPVSIDRRDAEGRYLVEPAHGLTPERLFERRWALAILEQSLDQLSREFRETGKGALYDRLKAVLTGAHDAVSYADVGQSLGMTEAAVKKAAQRLREQFRGILHERILETVSDPRLVDDEIRALFSSLAL
jgi:RNA polymerase sigma-70 factor (ECF subfamily)